MFSNHVYKTIILPTLVIRIPNLEIFLFYQHNSTGGGNLELRQTIGENSQILTVSNKKIYFSYVAVPFLRKMTKI
jgi:hypothetical protein